MAEVQKLATSDIPIKSPTVENVADATNVGELGTSPTQERSSNSHPHDSEYDTASDLEGGDTSDAEEGGEEYDEDETDLDDETDEDDEDDIENEDAVPLGVDVVGSSEKVGESEAQKKVDEDRSNPQYIPKRGTFYEHDDRMADGENDGVLKIADAPGGLENIPKGAVKTSSQSPSISHASKTLKKFQPASASERWTHDRFDPSEQQPKSDAEIINQYGFNMRNESNPPRARRRRRYTRGPNKYDRKWEDENAYIKAPNKDRKPPRASDFPALNERARKPRRTSRDHEDDKERRDEKENRPERRRTGGVSKKSSVNERLNLNAARPNQGEDRCDRDDLRNKHGGKSSVQSRLNNAGVTRQPAMEFKQKNRNNRPTSSHQSNNSQNNSRSDERFDRQNQRYTTNQTNYGNTNEEQYQQKQSIKNSSHMKQTQPIQGDAFNNNNNNSSNSNNQGPTNVSAKQRTTWQISSGMQQQQPAHVGSVQMHALASQNQQQQQQLVMGQQPPSNTMIMSAMPQQQQQQHQHQHQQQQQLIQTQSQEQRGPPKRYSSMRRSQHDAQHLPDAHTHQQQQLQQMHMQPPPPQTPQQTSQGPQALIMPDQHNILQANLLQMYHQENLQAQMQALQVSQTAPAPQSKQTAYTGVPPPAAQTAPPPPVYGPSPANAAYYVADTYGASTGNSQATPTATQYVPPQQPAFLAPTQSNAAALAYTTQPQPAQTSIPGGPPTATVYAGPQPAANTNQNFSNYQNYNTVGGTTYFVPPAPTTTRPVVLPQRRPTNAIPILHPSEKNKQRANEMSKEDASKLVVVTAAQMDSGENIDHIIDNMFVQRPAFQPPQAASMSSISNTESIVNVPETQTSSQNSIDLNTLASHSSSKASNLIAESSPNSISSAPKSNEVSSPTINTNSSAENSNNNNSITPQE